MLMFLLVLGGWQWSPGKKGMKGEYREDAALVDRVAHEKACRVDTGDVVVWTLTKEVRNPLFEGSQDNVATLHIAWPQMPAVGTRVYFPNDSTQICYREEGRLLMFETFQATGWIEVQTQKGNGQVGGKMELNLVKPHHNFSNSDFQFLGGDFRLQAIQSQ